MEAVETQNTTLPTIVISEDIQKPDCPYTVSVEREDVVDLLRQAGVREDDIDKLTIELRRKPDSTIAALLEEAAPGKLVAGRYIHDTRTIQIYTDSFWAAQEGFTKAANTYLESNGQQLSPKDWTDTPSRRRLTGYLLNAPRERAKGFVNRLANHRINRMINTTLAHESKHAGDRSQNIRYVARKDWGKVSLYLALSDTHKEYAERAGEKRAYEFQKIGPRLNILSITPK